MALFKVFRGPEADLPETLHDGYSYVAIDDSNDTATFWTDVPDGSGGTKRVKIVGEKGQLPLAITLAVNSWNNKVQVVSNSNFVADGYYYLVAPDSTSYADYTNAQIYADDVSADGQMTFHCVDTPDSAITVNILRGEVQE